jgi:hypothetical protein
MKELQTVQLHFILCCVRSDKVLLLLPSRELPNLWRGMLEKKDNFQLA